MKRLGLLAAAGLACAGPASAEVVASSETGFVTQETAAIAAPPQDVWAALIEPAKWWNDAHSWSGDASNMTIEARAGGCFCEVLPGEGEEPDGSVMHATVVQAVPYAALRMRGGLGPLQSEAATGVLTIRLQPVEGGTLVEWEYNVGGPMRFPVDQIAPAVDGVMTQQLHGLRDHLGALNLNRPEATND